jgi:hypothetical protein
MVSTQAVLHAGEASAARDRVLAFLARPDVRGQMEALGVSPEEASARAGSLSDREVLQIDAMLDTVPAGGDLFGVALTVLIVLFLLLVITELLGWTDVFPFLSPLPRGSVH